MGEKALKANQLLDIFIRDRMRSAALQASALNHEFHTPLTIIKGMAENLLQSSNQGLHSQLREIASEATKLLHSLENFNFASREEGLQKHATSLKRLISQTVSHFEKACLEKGISLQVDVDASIMINTESYKFKSIVGSLLQNAIESFECSEKHKTKSITIHTQENNSFLAVIISDTGCGISEEMQKKIRNDFFKNFETLELGATLGLPLVYYLSKGLHIDIDFVSEKNFGTSFTLTFKK
jgi:two-component system, NarL family, sensor histidine kinase EvgS